MLFILLATIVALVFLWRNWTYSFWRKQHVPCPEPTFPVGNLGSILSMKKHMGVVLEEWYKEYKTLPWIGMYKITTPAIMVRDLDLIKNILIKDFSSFQDNDMDVTHDELFAKNPFILKGKAWKTARACLSPLFTLNKCKQLFPLMQPVVQRLREYLISNGPDHIYDAKTLSSLFTTENVAKCGYSIDAGCFANPKNDFREMGKKIFQPSFLTGLKFILQMFMPSLTKVFKTRFVPQEIAQWLGDMLAHNIAERKKTPMKQEDIMQWLLNGMDQEKMDEHEAISHAFSFFIEGFETSGNVLSFALYAMAKNPDIQQRLREEMHEVLERHNNELTFDAMQEMTYLDCVVHETMRMYPPGTNMSKRCTQPYEMPLLPGQTTPFVCQPGTLIMIPVLAIHRDEEVYPNPETFDPERFSESERKNRHKAAYLPMGEGPRICLGVKFAQTQIKVALAQLVLDNEVILVSPEGEIVSDPAALMFQSKESVLIKFKPISKV